MRDRYANARRDCDGSVCPVDVLRMQLNRVYRVLYHLHYRLPHNPRSNARIARLVMVRDDLKRLDIAAEALRLSWLYLKRGMRVASPLPSAEEARHAA